MAHRKFVGTINGVAVFREENKVGNEQGCIQLDLTFVVNISYKEVVFFLAYVYHNYNVRTASGVNMTLCMNGVEGENMRGERGGECESECKSKTSANFKLVESSAQQFELRFRGAVRMIFR